MYGKTRRISTPYIDLQSDLSSQEITDVVLRRFIAIHLVA
jgi:hypothetical protein